MTCFPARHNIRTIGVFSVYTVMSPQLFLFASGSNARGQLASGTLEDSHTFTTCTFQGSPNTRRILDIASGSNYALALIETEGQVELWGCGDGSRGQLGPSYPRKVNGVECSVFRPLDLPLERYGLEGYKYQLIASAWETCYLVLTSEGKGDVVVSMGADDFGDLGIGGSSNGKGKTRPLPLNIINFEHLAIRGEKIDTGTFHIELLSAGPHHIVAHARCQLDSSLEYFTIGWGASRQGQLGLAHTFVATPRIVPIAKDRVISSALGNQHSIFLHASGHISYLGSNKKGQLNDLNTLKDVQEVGSSWYGSYAIVKSEDGDTRIFATGSHEKGQLGRHISNGIMPAPSTGNFSDLPTSLRLTKMACGSEHVLSLFSTEQGATEVWGWGWNEHGNLGVSDTNDVRIPRKIWPRSGEEMGKVVGIWAGCGTSWIAVER